MGITINSKVIEQAAFIITDYYENGALYIGLYAFDENGNMDYYDDISTYIMPVLPGQFYVETGSEIEQFVKEQNNIFFPCDITVKQGFNRYSLYQFNWP